MRTEIAAYSSAGYRVYVVDPVSEHVAAAGVLPGVTAVLGDARPRGRQRLV